MPYEDLTLDTSDHVRIRAFLLVQRKVLPALPSEREQRESGTDSVRTGKDVELDSMREPADDEVRMLRDSCLWLDFVVNLPFGHVFAVSSPRLARRW